MLYKVPLRHWKPERVVWVETERKSESTGTVTTKIRMEKTAPEGDGTGGDAASSTEGPAGIEGGSKGEESSLSAAGKPAAMKLKTPIYLYRVPEEILTPGTASSTLLHVPGGVAAGGGGGERAGAESPSDGKGTQSQVVQLEGTAQ